MIIHYGQPRGNIHALPFAVVVGLHFLTSFCSFPSCPLVSLFIDLTPLSQNSADSTMQSIWVLPLLISKVTLLNNHQRLYIRTHQEVFIDKRSVIHFQKRIVSLCLKAGGHGQDHEPHNGRNGRGSWVYCEVENDSRTRLGRTLNARLRTKDLLPRREGAIEGVRVRRNLIEFVVL